MDTNQANPEMDLETIYAAKYNRKMLDLERKMEEYQQLSEPVSEEEFLEELRKQLPEATEENLKERTDQLYLNAIKKNKYVSKLDLFELKRDITDVPIDLQSWDMLKNREEMRERGETYILPKFYPLTPIPDYETYDPEEYYNLKEDISNPIRPTISREKSWFDQPKHEHKKNPGEILLLSRKIWKEAMNKEMREKEEVDRDGYFELPEKMVRDHQKDVKAQNWDIYKNYDLRVGRGQGRKKGKEE